MLQISHWFTRKNALSALYIFGVLIVTMTLEAHPDSVWQGLYLLFAPAMLLARFVPKAPLKHWSAAFAAALLTLGGVISPQELEAIEEGFILIPLLYLILYPGKFHAMAVALLLMVPYFFGSPDDDMAGLIEDASELLIITGFASIMAYYQRRTTMQMQAFRRDSLTDYLTQLANRLSYSQTLHEVDALSPAQRQHYTLLLIDLDDFKRINDLYGHSHGDLLLRQFSQRLSRQQSGRVFRIGGDEFAILLDSADPTIVAGLASQLIEDAQAPFHFLNRTVKTSISVGIAKYDERCQNAESLARDADLALYEAKARGKNQFVFFEQTHLDDRLRQDRLEREMVAAIHNEQFFLVYQPKVEQSSGQIIGVEALVRWQHPELGAISPEQFIPLAEATRQIIPLGRWILLAACRQTMLWRKAGYKVTVSVNVSAIQLEHDNILDAIREALIETGLPADQLQIEITETSIMANIATIIPALLRLREEGVQLAVDDFGVAYSSLSQLTRLPLDVLKIDKSFVDFCHTNHQNRMMVRTIIQLAQNLHMSVIAEGVEESAQRDVLLAEGCVLAQGFFFHRPLTVAVLTDLLATSNRLSERH